MAGGIRILRAIPGSPSFEPILRDFCKREGVVTAFSDSLLAVCRKQVPEDSAVEVVQFGKLVRDLLALSGELTPLIASTGHSLAAMAHACSQLGEESPFRAASRFPGTHLALERTLEELRDWGIDRYELARLAEVSSPRLSAKLRSLAFLDTESARLLEMLGRAHSDALITSSLEAILEVDGSYNRILIFAQGEVPPLKASWIRWASSFGLQITVVLDRHATGAGLFQSAEAAELQLEGEATPQGVGNRLLNNLFSASDAGGAEIQVEISSASDSMSEAEWAIRGCLALEDPMSAAIYARDLESYAPLIESAARRLQVPVCVPRKAPLLTNSFAKLTLAALQFALARDVRSLRPILQSSYLRLDGEAREKLQQAIREAYRMRALQWDVLTTWAEQSKEEFPWLHYLLEWRKKARGGPYSWREWLPVIGDILRADEVLPWSTSVLEGDPRMRSRDNYARNRIERIIGDHVSIQASLGHRFVPLDELVRMCEELMHHAEVTIPADDFGVRVSNQAEAISGADTVFVLGMLEGIFPRRRSEDPVLTDAERKAISELRPGKPQLKDSHDRANEERDEFYRVCGAAKNRLVFSYPTADDDRDNIPAFYLEEIKRAIQTHSHSHARGELAPLPAVAEADIRLRASLDGPRELPPPVELTSDEARRSLVPAPDQGFTPSEIRDALQCPFQYVARHRLRLRPKRHQSRWVSLQRLPQRAELARASDADAAERSLTKALELILEELMADLPEWESQLLQSGGKRLIGEWVQREMKARAKWPKNDDSLRTDVRFGDGLNSEMPKRLATLAGSVAATSTMQGYRVGHLYTTRAPENQDLTPTDKLYYGLHFLALHESGAVPALEIETMSGERQLMLLYRRSGALLPSEQPAIRTLDLAAHDDAAQWVREFYGEVTELLKQAMSHIREGSITPLPGEHCTWCDYGELCRRSPFYGEEDSPFGVDRLVVEDE